MTVILAYLIFAHSDLTSFRDFLEKTGYIGTFFAGMSFTYGFTAAPATAVLLILAKTQNIVIAGFLAGIGALVADLIIFNFIKYSFIDEIERLSQEKLVKRIDSLLPFFTRKYFIMIIASIIIASPLPDEIGVVMLAASRKISTKMFSLISFILNTSGIFIILIIGKFLI
ncbi:MAG: hypothetical protein QXG00_02195 [Candidatus Woesearchaeota archaeon]